MLLFDPALATARLIDGLGRDALARSEAYTLGSDLLVVAGAAVWILIALLAVRVRLMERLLGMFEHWPRWRLHLFAIAAFFIIFDLVRLPWAILSQWGHRRAFGLTSQPLGDFIGQYELDSIFTALVASLFFLALFALIRKVGGRWWVSAGGIAAIGMAAILLLGPPLLAPLFNSYHPVPPGPMKAELEQIADRAKIARDRIFVFDASRQSDQFVANVGGIGPAARIAISDTALRGVSLDEVKVVTAHEAGHYVFGHTSRNALVVPVLAVFGLAFIAWVYRPVARLMRCSAPIGDPAGLPVFVALIAAISVAATPLINFSTRLSETAADRYALDTTALPDALASALLRTAESRYPRPSRLEEVLFYSHPSIESRIRAAMDWKAAHLPAGSAGGTTAR